MKISPYTAQHLARMVIGELEGWPYRRGVDLVDLFNRYGFREIYGDGFPSRYQFAEKKITEMSGKPVLKDLFKDLLDGRFWIGKPGCKTVSQCADELNEL